MDIEVYKEAITNADMAFNNENYESALNWYNKALEQQPNDEYALSKGGASLVTLGRFEESFGYFQRAVNVGPDNGDNIFNLGNAYFFAGDISKALEYYTQAQMKTCSDDVKSRIYYQMALLNTINQDFRSALINYQKYEDSDPTGKASLDTDILSDKVNIYLQLEDFDGAVQSAVKWVSLAPGDIRAHVVYFNVLMADEKYAEALKELDDAQKYAVTDDEGKFAIDLCRANYYAAAAGSSVDTEGDYDSKAYDLLSELIMSPIGDGAQKDELVLSLAELCIKMGKVDEAIETMKFITDKPDTAPAAAPVAHNSTPATPEEIDAMMQNDLSAMDDKLAKGEVDESLGENTPVNYDENGQAVRDYPDGVFGEDVFPGELGAAIAESEKAEAAETARSVMERVNYMLLSCYAFKEDYEKALEYSRIVKNNPTNTYYAFFGRYSEAFSMMQLAKKGQGITMEEAQRKYDEVIAFFRSEMLKANADSAYALLFRTRMYAECGKFAKAEELAALMNESDKASVMQYIDECKKEQGAQ